MTDIMTDDDPLPEGVDFSEGGWATDYATSIIAILFFITSIVPSRHGHYSKQQKPGGGGGASYPYFRYMFLGTAIAHMGGAKAHRYFYNRASDGTGQVGFYISMMIGYTGNCIRYGVGWGLSNVWMYVALVNLLLLYGSGLACIIDMDRTVDTIDSVDEEEFDGVYVPDTLFMGGEVIASLCELVTSLIFLWKNKSNIYAWITCLVNAGGWIVVYGAYGVSVSMNFE